MEAVFINKSLANNLSLKEVTTTFFKKYSPDSTKVLFWKFFQCWALKDCKIKADVTDEEVALFFDQLIDLVMAAYIVHQGNDGSQTGQKGISHE